MAKEVKRAGVSLTLGILGIAFALLFPIVGIVLSIVGLVWSNKDIEERKVFAKGAKICSILGIVLSVLNMLFTLALILS